MGKKIAKCKVIMILTFFYQINLRESLASSTKRATFATAKEECASFAPRKRKLFLIRAS
jgi:hypothetical protein